MRNYGENMWETEESSFAFPTSKKLLLPSRTCLVYEDNLFLFFIFVNFNFKPGQPRYCLFNITIKCHDKKLIARSWRHSTFVLFPRVGDERASATTSKCLKFSLRDYHTAFLFIVHAQPNYNYSRFNFIIAGLVGYFVRNRWRMIPVNSFYFICNKFTGNDSYQQSTTNSIDNTQGTMPNLNNFIAHLLFSRNLETVLDSAIAITGLIH